MLFFVPHVNENLYYQRSMLLEDTEIVEAILEFVFDGPVPRWLWAMGVFAAAVARYHKPILSFMALMGSHLPSREQRERDDRWRLFAQGVVHELLRIDDQDAWEDEQYAELEVEVDTRGRIESLLGKIFGVHRNSLRRRHSLTQTLATSKERVILLQGEPGSGKSVALRHLALRLARRAARRWRRPRVIPIYINLRSLRVAPEEVSADSIRSFVLTSINRGRSVVVDRFLEEEFERGLTNGNWLFLFDSFDEIPAVLSSTEHDVVVHSYRDAISDFLHPLVRCRGIIASRLFRGPTGRAWTRFRVAPLSEQRQRALVKRAGLSAVQQVELIGSLALASNDLRIMAHNPLFLRMLCDYINSGGLFPSYSFEVFRSYVTRRLSRDAPLVSQRYGLDVERVKHTAQTVAFAMSADPHLGLIPTRSQLQASLASLGFLVPQEFDRHLDALEYIRIGRSDVGVDGATFSFAHRRLQEYFATAVLIHDSERMISPRRLLLDARWREPAVALFQTSAFSALSPLIEEAVALLSTAPSEVNSDNGSASASNRQIHIMRLLQDGLAPRRDELSEPLREAVRTIILRMSEGSFEERKLALDLGGLLPAGELDTQVQRAFRDGGAWIRDAAFWQLRWLASIPKTVSQEIRLDLVARTLRQTVNSDRHATLALLQRVRDNRALLRAARRLHQVRAAELLLLCGNGAYVFVAPGRSNLPGAFVLAILLSVNYIQFRTGVFARWGIGAQWFVRFWIFISYFIAWAVAVRNMERGSYEYGLSAIGVCLVFYSFTLTPTTLMAVKRGRFLAWWMWPLPPLVYAIGPLALFCFCLAYVVPSLVDAARGMTFSVPAWVEILFEWISLAWLWIMVLGVLSAPVIAVFEWNARRRDWNLVKNRSAGQLSSEEFGRILMSLRTETVAAEFLRQARESDLYAKSPETLVLLREKARHIDANISGRMAKKQASRQRYAHYSRNPVQAAWEHAWSLVKRLAVKLHGHPPILRWSIVAIVSLGTPLAALALLLSDEFMARNEPISSRDLSLEDRSIEHRDQLNRLIEVLREELSQESNSQPPA